MHLLFPLLVLLGDSTHRSAFRRAPRRYQIYDMRVDVYDMRVEIYDAALSVCPVSDTTACRWRVVRNLVIKLNRPILQATREMIQHGNYSLGGKIAAINRYFWQIAPAISRNSGGGYKHRPRYT